MNTPKITNRHLLLFVQTFWQWRFVWIATTIAFGAIALLYVAFLKSDTWVSSQGIIVRDEANGAVMRLGRFQSQTEMKAAQETILEMARNRQVLLNALTRVGREPAQFSWQQVDLSQPPTTAEVEDLARNGIEVRAPRGAQFGTTEVIYLDVKQHSRDRAILLNEAVCDELEKQLQHVRQVRADGVIAELRTAADTARKNLTDATTRLQAMEAKAGADLSDLRGLTETVTGGSTNRQMLDVIKAELRSAELQHQRIETDLEMAVAAFADPDQLLLAPTDQISDNPGLRKLREGLSDALINSSRLKGRYTQEHPLLVAALDTEAKIREQLRRELSTSISALRQQREISKQRIEKLKSQRDQLESRLVNLANIRAEYGNLSEEVRSRSQQLQDAERELAQAEASREAALTSSLITRLDRPLIGESPEGPGRTTILAGATVCGLLFGIGVVFLLTPLDGSGPRFGRRQTDYNGAVGRRASDQPGGQRERRRAARDTNSTDAESATPPLAKFDEPAAEGTSVDLPHAGPITPAAGHAAQGPGALASSTINSEVQAKTLNTAKASSSESPAGHTQASQISASQISASQPIDAAAGSVSPPEARRSAGPTAPAQPSQPAQEVLLAQALQGSAVSFSAEANSVPARPQNDQPA